jgi:hypothetical protein
MKTFLTLAKSIHRFSVLIFYTQQYGLPDSWRIKKVKRTIVTNMLIKANEHSKKKKPVTSAAGSLFGWLAWLCNYRTGTVKHLFSGTSERLTTKTRT